MTEYTTNNNNLLNFCCNCGGKDSRTFEINRISSGLLGNGEGALFLMRLFCAASNLQPFA